METQCRQERAHLNLFILGRLPQVHLWHHLVVDVVLGETLVLDAVVEHRVKTGVVHSRPQTRAVQTLHTCARGCDLNGLWFVRKVNDKTMTLSAICEKKNKWRRDRKQDRRSHGFETGELSIATEKWSFDETRHCFNQICAKDHTIPQRVPGSYGITDYLIVPDCRNDFYYRAGPRDATTVHACRIRERLNHTGIRSGDFAQGDARPSLHRHVRMSLTVDVGVSQQG